MGEMDGVGASVKRSAVLNLCKRRNAARERLTGSEKH